MREWGTEALPLLLTNHRVRVLLLSRHTIPPSYIDYWQSTTTLRITSCKRVCVYYTACACEAGQLPFITCTSGVPHFIFRNTGVMRNKPFSCCGILVCGRKVKQPVRKAKVARLPVHNSFSKADVVLYLHGRKLFYLTLDCSLYLSTWPRW